jgi:hypothetical protein
MYKFDSKFPRRFREGLSRFSALAFYHCHTVSILSFDQVVEIKCKDKENANPRDFKEPLQRGVRAGGEGSKRAKS